MEILSKRLQELRKEHNWKQEEVASKCDLVLRTYRRYETEGDDPRASTLVKIADLYGVSLDYLTGRTDQRTFNPGNEREEPQARQVACAKGKDLDTKAAERSQRGN